MSIEAESDVEFVREISRNMLKCWAQSRQYYWPSEEALLRYIALAERGAKVGKPHSSLYPITSKGPYIDEH